MAKKRKTTSLRQELANQIRESRRQKGLTQEELAFQCNLHRTYISLLERALKSPTIDALDRIATALATKPSVLLAQAETALGVGES